MFSIENLLSSKYTPKSLQRCGEIVHESVKSTKKGIEDDDRRNENSTERELESQLGKRDSAYVKVSVVSDGLSEGREEEKVAAETKGVRGRKRLSEGDSGRESCSCDEGKQDGARKSARAET